LALKGENNAVQIAGKKFGDTLRKMFLMIRLPFGKITTEKNIYDGKILPWPLKICSYGSNRLMIDHLPEWEYGIQGWRRTWLPFWF
jgi:hypothetical protein